MSELDDALREFESAKELTEEEAALKEFRQAEAKSEEKPQSTWTEALSMGALSGLPLIGGLVDEGVAGFQTVFGGDRNGMSFGDYYRDQRDSLRQGADTVRAERPKTYGGAELAVGLAAPIPGLGAIKGASGLNKLMGLGAEEAFTRSNADLTKGEVLEAAGDTAGGAVNAFILGSALRAGGNLAGKAGKLVTPENRAKVAAWLKEKSKDWTIGAMRLPPKMTQRLKETGKDEVLADYLHENDMVKHFDNNENVFERLQAAEPAAEKRVEHVYNTVQESERKAMQAYLAREAERAAIRKQNIKRGPRTVVEGEPVIPGARPPRKGAVDVDFAQRQSGAAPIARPEVVDNSRALGDGIPQDLAVRNGLEKIEIGTIPPEGLGPSNQMPVPESLEMPPLFPTRRVANNMRNINGTSEMSKGGAGPLQQQAERQAESLENSARAEFNTIETPDVPLKSAREYRTAMGKANELAFGPGSSGVGSKGMAKELYGQLTDAVKEHADELARKYNPELVGEARAADLNYSTNLLAQDLTSRADAASRRNRAFQLSDYLAAIAAAGAPGGIATQFAAPLGNKLLRERGGFSTSKLLRSASKAVQPGSKFSNFMESGVDDVVDALQHSKASGVIQSSLIGKSGVMEGRFQNFLRGDEPKADKEESENNFVINSRPK